MTDFELSKLITEALERAQRASIGTVFMIKPSTFSKLSAIDSIIGSYKEAYSVEFDWATNSFDIGIESYVFDSITDNLKELFLLTDLFVIDALADGKVCIEMKLLNACIKSER